MLLHNSEVKYLIELVLINSTICLKALKNDPLNKNIVERV